MIRKRIAVLMAIMTLVTLIVLLISIPFDVWWQWGDRSALPHGAAGFIGGKLVVHHYRSGRTGPDFRLALAGMHVARHFANYYSAEDHSLEAGFWEASNVQELYIELPLWMVCVLFSVYPLTSLAVPRYLRARRRKRGACPECGYDLTGNVSGVCPECGSAITPPRAPPSR